jgi:hypothetical protein
MNLELVKNSKLRIFLALILATLLVAVVISACNINIGGVSTPPPPTASAILAPPKQTKVVVGAPVQIQSAFPGENISRVELFVQGPAGGKLIRADVPTDGFVLQEWVPDQPGSYTITARAYTSTAAAAISSASIQLEVLQGSAVSIPTRDLAVVLVSPTATPIPGATEIRATPTGGAGEAAGAFRLPTGTPLPPVSVQVVTPANLTPTATPPLVYPPPPPLPGVPKGPTQDMLPLKIPPVCDAAEYLGVFSAVSTGQRIFIPTDDQLAAKVVGGSVVHRAWRLRNIGTCTWGPGYQLDLYGGRDMGSGGVAFGLNYPADPGRTNVVVSTERLIVPEAEPNQAAVLELLLQAPSTPGIHQSYWRMRNPQGVWFGPIIGVTFEVVRDCQPIPGGPIIYGAPIINRFEVLGVGDVFEPDTPTDVIAEFGDTVTIEWDVINATNFDIILENPLGDISTLSNTTTRGRAQFIAGELGTYIITIYADNGPCAFTAQINILVLPRDVDLFELDIILAPSSAVASAGENVGIAAELDAGDVKAEWSHIDAQANTFVLLAELYQKREERCSIFEFELPAWIPCSTETWVPTNIAQSITLTDSVTIRDEDLGVQGAAVVNNLESSLCQGRTPPENYGVRYVMQAFEDGRPATPQFSNTVDVLCSGIGLPSPRRELPTEIQNQQFSP